MALNCSPCSTCHSWDGKLSAASLLVSLRWQKIEIRVWTDGSLWRRYLSSHPFKPRWYLYPLYPLAVAIFLVLRVFGKPFTAMKHRLNKMRLHVRVIPAWGVQYFMKVCEPRPPLLCCERSRLPRSWLTEDGRVPLA
jgi:hypothetical protein